jgi:lactaldehyde reductase
MKGEKMMAVNRFVLNQTSYFGPGARKKIMEEIKQRSFKKAFVVTDKELIKFHVAEMVFKELEAVKFPYQVYDNVKQNPTISNVQQGVDTFKSSGADFIIAIGGGSPIDTAKGIGIIVNNPEFYDVCSLEGTAATKKPSVPIIALPTTAGTAAEVTINYVITDEKKIKKMVCVDPHDIPVLAIVDPELMLSMPKGLTTSTGMDALTHAIEGYITKGAWEMSDTFSLKAIQMIARNLEKVAFSLSDITARDGMAVAQYIAGMSFSNVGLGLVHGMAHPLGAFYDTPHGVANALLLPYVMEFNAPAAKEKFREIARMLGVPEVDKLSLDEAAAAAVNAVKALSLRIGIPQKLHEIGVKEADLEKLAQAAFNDVCTPGNPRSVTVVDILALYRKAY